VCGGTGTWLIIVDEFAPRIQNSHDVSLGSREDVQGKPRTGKDGFLCHPRLGLVGWISYCYLGDSDLAVSILVVLIKTLGLTERVSDALGSRKNKEAETNGKIVDLLKHTLDETKHCRNEQQRVEFHIALGWSKSRGARLYVYQADLLDRSCICVYSHM